MSAGKERSPRSGASVLAAPRAQGQERRAHRASRATERGARPARGRRIARVLVGEGSPVELGTPALILDVELAKGGTVSIPVQAGFNGFVHMLAAEASFGANRRRATIVGPGSSRPHSVRQRLRRGESARGRLWGLDADHEQVSDHREFGDG